MNLRLAAAALNTTPLDWLGNRATLLQAIKAAQSEGVHLLTLPELCLTGYGCEDWFLADWVADKAWSVLESLLPETYGIAVVVGLPIRWQGRTFNGAAVVADGRILGVTLKQHLANDGIHYERRWFSPWPAGQTAQHESGVAIGDLVYDWQGYRFGIEICEDAWHGPHRPAHSLKARGAQLIVSPNASHFALGKLEKRQELVREASHLGLAYVYANLLGNEAGRALYGGDVLFASAGGTWQQASQFFSFQPYVLSVWNTADNSVLTSALPAVTNPEEEFRAAVRMGLWDYLRKSRSASFVLSLSGGADSSACAVLVADMVRHAELELGPSSIAQALQRPELAEKQGTDLVQALLLCAYQATENSSEATLLSARDLAQSLGAQFFHWSVSSSHQHILSTLSQALGQDLTWDQHDIALQNVQARIRSPYIWMLTNVTRSLLITTSNRSEGDVGYATMDGDTSGSISPLAGISKPFIINWLRYMQGQGYPGLARVNALTPTAELRPAERSQTDEADLMPYPLLEAIERLAIGQRAEPVTVYQQLLQQGLPYSPDYVKQSVIRFFRLWSINQWKRERLAPSFHLDDFNVDPKTWCRFPILSGGFADELKALSLAD